MERDIKQKMGLIKLFWHWGYTPDIDVKLFYSGGTAKNKLEITDVDVLGFKVTPELTLQRIAGDCKTKKKESAINRAFWLSGIMEYLAIKRGFVVFSRNIETDHKMAAQQLGITLLNDDDFGILLAALLPPDFPHDMNLFNPEMWQKFFAEAQSQHNVKKLWNYRRERYWQDTAQNGLRYTLMEMRLHRKEFGQQKNRILNNIFVDVITAFAISLSRMLLEIFQVYLISNKKEELDHQIKAYVYGGRTTYEHLNNLTKQVLQLRMQLTGKVNNAGNAPVPQDALALPEWDHFMQLFRTILDAPSHFFVVPRLLRYVLFERMLQPTSSVGVFKAIPNLSNRSVKFALDLLKYFSTASQIPEHIWHPVRNILDDILLNVPSTVAQSVAQTSTESIKIISSKKSFTDGNSSSQ